MIKVIITSIDKVVIETNEADALEYLEFKDNIKKTYPGEQTTQLVGDLKLIKDVYDFFKDGEIPGNYIYNKTK